MCGYNIGLSVVYPGFAEDHSREKECTISRCSQLSCEPLEHFECAPNLFSYFCLCISIYISIYIYIYISIYIDLYLCLYLYIDV